MQIQRAPKANWKTMDNIHGTFVRYIYCFVSLENFNDWRLITIIPFGFASVKIAASAAYV